MSNYGSEGETFDRLQPGDRLTAQHVNQLQQLVQTLTRGQQPRMVYDSTRGMLQRQAPPSAGGNLVLAVCTGHVEAPTQTIIEHECSIIEPQAGGTYTDTGQTVIARVLQPGGWIHRGAIVKLASNADGTAWVADAPTWMGIVWHVDLHFGGTGYAPACSVVAIDGAPFYVPEQMDKIALYNGTGGRGWHITTGVAQFPGSEILWGEPVLVRYIGMAGLQPAHEPCAWICHNVPNFFGPPGADDYANQEPAGEYVCEIGDPTLPEDAPDDDDMTDYGQSDPVIPIPPLNGD